MQVALGFATAIAIAVVVLFYESLFSDLQYRRTIYEPYITCNIIPTSNVIDYQRAWQILTLHCVLV